MYYDVFSYLVDYILKMIFTTGLCMQHGEKIVPAPKKSGDKISMFWHLFNIVTMTL